MPKSEGSVIISIPIEKVFNTVADPEEMTNCVSSVLADFGGEPGELESYAEWT
jgi:carbon monoxide dehydrogenase subunit G